MEKKGLNDIRFLKKELKGVKEIANIKRWDTNLINIKLSNEINITLDFNYSSFIVLNISYKFLKLRKTSVGSIWELEQHIKSFGQYSKEFLENLIKLKNKLQEIFFYNLDFYLEKQFLSIHFNTRSNNINRLNIKFNDTIEIKLIYNIGTTESGIVNDIKDINKEKTRKTELVKEIIKKIFEKEVKIQNKDYVALEKERLFNFIDNMINAVNENNQVVFNEILDEFLRDLN